jgi:hypothetical protein
MSFIEYKDKVYAYKYISYNGSLTQTIILKKEKTQFNKSQSIGKSLTNRVLVRKSTCVTINLLK